MLRPHVDWTTILPVGLFLLLALLVIGPALAPGYVLLLDLPWARHLLPPTDGPSGWPLYAWLTLCFHALTPPLTEKLSFVAIFVAAGLGMYRLLRVNTVARFAAAILYTINPYTYSRLMTGQYLVLAGYALMPWFIMSLMRFTGRPNLQAAMRIAAWTIAIGFVSLHFLGMAILTAAVGLPMLAIRRRREPGYGRRLAGWSTVVVAIVIAANSFWLVPAILGHSAQSGLVSSFSDRYFLAFRTSADPHLGQLANTIGLYGFWGDDQHLYVSPKTAMPYWWAIALLIMALAAIGAAAGWRTQRRMTALLLILGLIGLVLAQGIMGSPFAGFNDWLVRHVWIYRAYREPGKLIGLVALSMCYLFGLGSAWLLDRTRSFEWGRGVLAGLLIALPVAYTPTMLWGAAGQLKAVSYPADWYAQNAALDSDRRPGQILFLPWHQYMYFRFAGRIIANPASRFFDRPVVQGDNAQIGLIQYQSQSQTSRAVVQEILSPVTGQRDLGPRLRKLGISYVILAKEADYQNYRWLDRSPGLQLASDTKTLLVYKVLP